MAKKSIIDIDVNDEKFKEFLNLFKEYQENLEEMPQAWQKLGEAMGGSSSTFNKSSAATMKILQESAMNIAMMAESLREATKAQEQFYHATTVSNSGMNRLVRSASHLGKSLFGIGRELFKLASIGAIGGAFGMFGLGEAAYKRQREARGLGLSTGQITSFKTYMAPFVEPGDLLNRAANAKSDMTKWWALSAMHIPVGKALHENAEQLSFDLIDQARKIWKQGPQTLQYAEARGLTTMGFSLDDLRRLVNTPGSQIKTAEANAVKNAGVLGFSPKVGDEYTKMVITLRKAGAEIETVLIKGLAPLAPLFSKVAKSLSGDFVRFMNEPGTKKAVANIGSEIRDFASFLGSKALRTDIADFGEAIKDVTKAVLWVTKKYESFKPDFNLSHWGEAAKDLLWPIKSNFGESSFTPALAPSRSGLLRSRIPDHIRKSATPDKSGGDTTSTILHKLIGQANRGRAATLPTVNVKVQVPAGFAAERQMNAAGH